MPRGEKMIRSGPSNFRYRHGHVGKHKTPTYNSWLMMKQRCLNPRDPRWKDYGGRGIVICSRWMDFTNFLADMGVRPLETSLERMNTNGNYEPGNCKWATRKEQQRNMRTNHIVSYQGVSKPLVAWAEYLGVGTDMLRTRLRRGWSIERAMTVSVQAVAGN